MNSLNEDVFFELFNKLDPVQLCKFSFVNKYINKLCKSFAMHNINPLEMYYKKNYRIFDKIVPDNDYETPFYCVSCKNIHASIEKIYGKSCSICKLVTCGKCVKNEKTILCLTCNKYCCLNCTKNKNGCNVNCTFDL
jgi:hypothetical protein